MNSIEIIPTNTCPKDFATLSETSAFFSSFSSRVHLDVSDGVFTPVLSWPYAQDQWAELEEMISDHERLPFSERLYYEAHCMVSDPLPIALALFRLGCSRIYVHFEALKPREIGSIVKQLRDAGIPDVGCSLQLLTPLEQALPHLHHFSSVLCMSIPTLGKQGATFDERIYARIEYIKKEYPHMTIAVDGGVSEANITELVKRGVRRFGVGSAITKSLNPQDAFNRLLSVAQMEPTTEIYE